VLYRDGESFVAKHVRQGAGVFDLVPIGHVRSTLTARENAPRQPDEGAPEAWLELDPAYGPAAKDLRTGDEVLVLTWLHRSDRTTLLVHPRGNARVALTGVFSTRSPDRPNPIGIHRARIVEAAGATRFRVDALEAIDGTPIIDVKPVLGGVNER
jgi:tRNA-Thr(GGU) m(6)t(6)A37 methyltransferase TsaA